MSTYPDLGPWAPPILAFGVIIYIAIYQPVSTDYAGISMNWIAILIVALGGILGARPD